MVRMKTLTFFFGIITCLFSLNSYGQWTKLTSGTLDDLNDVHFPTLDTGYVVGDNGTVLKTTDAGVNWTNINISNAQDIRTIHFFNSNNGIIAGDSSTLMKTTNGGLSWTNLTVPLPSGAIAVVANDIHFPTPSVGYIGAKNIPSGGVIFKTTDGGDNWDTLSTNFPPLRTIYCLSSDTCFTMGYDPGISNLYKTTDGNNWFIVDSLVGLDFECIFFTNSNAGYITGFYSTATYKTIDGGNTWSTLIPASTYDLYDLYFPSSNTGYAVGWWGTIIKSTDEGTTWIRQEVPDSSIHFFSVDFIDNNTGYAVGTNGTILKTMNGGATGIYETSNYENFKIYPNPLTQRATLEFDNSNNDNYTLAIYSTQGKLVQTINNIITNKVEIKIKNLTNGLYFLHLHNDKGVHVTGKLIIKK